MAFGFRRRRSAEPSEPAEAQPQPPPQPVELQDGVEVVGYGIGLRPVPPFQVGRTPAVPVPDALVFARLDGHQGPVNMLVLPGRMPPSQPLRRYQQTDPRTGLSGWLYAADQDGPQIRGGVNVNDPREVATPVPGLSVAGWCLRARGYQFDWPEGWFVTSTEPGSQWPFELHLMDVDDRDNLLIVRGPMDRTVVPVPDSLVAPGQQLVDVQATDRTLWAEIAYSVDGRDWWQRHEVAMVGEQAVLVTGQVPATHAGAMAEAVSRVAMSISPVFESELTPFSLA